MKVVRKSNFRVTVDPRGLGDFGMVRVSDGMLHNDKQIEDGYQQRCEEIAREIKRHCDNVKSAYVECDKVDVCSHCGSTWEDQPTCCQKAINEWDPTGRRDNKCQRML